MPDLQLVTPAPSTRVAKLVEQMVRVRTEQASSRKRAYPHMRRHSYATWALNHGMNPIMLAQVLGHASL
jgi:site-specific recombinase XerD